MAEAVYEGAKVIDGVEVNFKKAVDATIDEVLVPDLDPPDALTLGAERSSIDENGELTGTTDTRASDIRQRDERVVPLLELGVGEAGLVLELGEHDLEPLELGGGVLDLSGVGLDSLFPVADMILKPV